MAWGNRWEWEHTRQSTGGLLKLDVRALNRAGCLRPGVVLSWQWTNGRGEPAGDIVMRMDRAGACLTLEYRTRRYGDTGWTPRTQPVWLETTPCHYGGERVWFTCPGCHSRCAVLFSAGGVFRCRRCHGLAYESIREDATERANRRIRRLHRKLHASAGCDAWTIPDKPPGMHWTTYDRLVGQLYAAIRRREEQVADRFSGLMGRTRSEPKR